MEQPTSPRTWREIFLARFWLRRHAHLVLLIWGAIYLPALGSLEIRGEEGRRILPGVTMNESGNYLVPRVGGKFYFRKPPLINWITAASFKLTGVRSEWTARLPSALAILAVALALVRLGAKSLGATGALLAAIVWLTNFGNIEKGRLIEIEALYVSLTALAFVFWIAAYRSGKSGLRLWLIPAVFLGLGMLAKGPLPHLLFFYIPVIALLWCESNLSLLVRREHGVALIIMFGIFAAWALPALLFANPGNVVGVWTRQFSGRMSGEEFQFRSWIMNIPRSLVYFLPWLPLAFLQIGRQPIGSARGEARPPSLPRRESADREGERPRGPRCNRALLAGIAIPFAIVNLMPGALPRFVMPSLAPAAWWFGELLSQESLHWPRWLGGKNFSAHLRNRIFVIVTAVVCVSMLAYATLIVPRLYHREKIKTHARQINAIVPASVPLYAVDPDYQPYLFYVNAPVRYVSSINELPPDTKFFLVQPENEEEAARTNHWAPARTQLVLRIIDYRKNEMILFAVQSR
jgi:4-amino-4-deoxy-L-arabinose transferase-like glycosyltransferase